MLTFIASSGDPVGGAVVSIDDGSWLGHVVKSVRDGDLERFRLFGVRNILTSFISKGGSIGVLSVSTVVAV